MRIGLDVRKLNDSGIGTYIRNLLVHLPAVDAGINLVLIADPAQVDQARLDFSGKQLEWHVNAAGKYSAKELFSVGRQANSLGLDLFHAPHFVLPFGLRPKRIVTIHDLIPLRFPHYFNRARRLYARAMMLHACRASDLIITGSQHTKSDVAAEFNVSPKKIRAIYHGVPAEFRPASAAAVAEFRTRHGLHQAFAFYGGNFKPHKDLPTLLRAFAAVSEEVLPHLVLVGDDIARHQSLRQLVRELQIAERVKLPGRIGQADLVSAYTAARAVVFPSRYEGFGFPAIEAMACGTPLIASRATSLPEVVADAGLLFEPGDEQALAALLRSISQDDGLHADLRERGFKRASEFPVQRCATQTVAAYREVTR